MNAAEVKTHVSNIERALKEKQPPSSLIDLLTALKKGVTASESLLRETKVGMAVNKLRVHNDKAVADLAKEIVGKWKKDVQKAKSSPLSSASSSQDVSKKRSASPKTPLSPPAKKPDLKVSKPTGPKVDPAKRNRKTDGVKYECTGNRLRDNCTGTVYDGLCMDSDAPSDHLLFLAKSLESCVYKNHKNETNAAYKRRIQSLYLNLRDKKNPGLRRRLVSGELSPERLSTMESHEMANEERQKEDQAMRQENLNKSIMPKAERSVSDQLRCGKCGQKKVSYTQAQTRSADEPMTTFCTCEHCGNMWKFS